MDFVIALDLPQLLNLFLAVIFPVLVGLVTTRVTSPGRKSILLAVIAFASGLVTTALGAIVAGVPFDIVAALLTGLASFIIAVAMHYGLWKPTGVSDAAIAVGSKPALDSDGALQRETTVQPRFTAETGASVQATTDPATGRPVKYEDAADPFSDPTHRNDGEQH